MAFNKIRETYLALTTPKRTVTIDEQIQAYSERLREASSGEKVAKASIRLGVYFLIVIPTAFMVFHILHQLTSFKNEMVGAIGITLAFFVGMAIQYVHDNMMKYIPFHKLNPLFGSKLDETIAAFKKQQ